MPAVPAAARALIPIPRPGAAGPGWATSPSPLRSQRQAQPTSRVLLDRAGHHAVRPMAASRRGSEALSRRVACGGPEGHFRRSASVPSSVNTWPAPIETARRRRGAGCAAHVARARWRTALCRRHAKWR
jgi:hypothetical protein